MFAVLGISDNSQTACEHQKHKRHAPRLAKSLPENAGHAAGEWTPSENPHLRRASEHPEFYEKTGKLFERHFEFFGEGGSESEDSSSYASTSSGSGAAGSG